MIDPTKFDDFVLWTGKGDVAPDPDPDAEASTPRVPPLTGLADMLKDLEVGAFVAVNVPESAKRVVTQRMDSAHRKITKSLPDRSFSISVEWFGVKLTRVT